MNYFKHHIGDYDADTAHLTWLEDMAYTRLMRLYYRREQPIPKDLNQACRLVRATSKQERDAVALVLEEFFVSTDEGWRNKRCDEEIEASKAKADANRDNGKKGGRPSKKETQEKPTGFSVGSQEEPTPNPQITLANSHKPLAISQEKRSASLRNPDNPDSTQIGRETELAILLRQQGVNITPMHPGLCQWVNSGLTNDEALEAVLRARRSKPAPEPIAAGYLSPIVADLLTERAARTQTTSPSKTRRNGHEAHPHVDNSAVGKVERAIRDQEERELRERNGLGEGGRVIDVGGEDYQHLAHS